MAEKGQESRPSLSKTNEETISSPRGNTWGYEETVSLLEVLGRGYHSKRFGKYTQTKHGHLQKDRRTNKCSDEGKWSFLQKNPCGMSFPGKKT